MKNATLILLAVIAFSACSKSSDDEPTLPTTKQLYPAKVVEKEADGTIFQETTYEYDSQNRLVKSISTENNKEYTEVYTNSYIYSSNGLAEITKTCKYGSEPERYNGKIVCNYVGGVLTTIFEYDPGDVDAFNKDTLFYQAGNRRPYIVKQHNGLEKNEITYDAAGNIATVKYTDDVKANVTTFSYDTKHPHFSWCLPNPSVLDGSFRYCPLETKVVGTEKGVTTYNEVNTFAYEFNADGYPTKVTVKSDYKVLTSENETDTKIYEITYK